MKEFFGIGGFQREPEGFMSWQHLLFVTILMALMVVLAVYLGKRYQEPCLLRQPSDSHLCERS